MKIIKLTVENVKRISAVAITPDPTMPIITGRNAQGKSSLFDAIELALAGGAASKRITRPVRDGETHAEVELVLGDENGPQLIVTRTWKGDKSGVVVRNAEGTRQEPSQRVLDSFYGNLGFDPMVFANLTEAKQRQALLDLVPAGKTLVELDAKRSRLFEARTEIGRREKALGTPPALHPDTPEQEVSASAILDRITEVQAQQRHHDAEMRKAEQAQSTVEYWTGKLAEAQRELAAAEAANAAQLAVLQGLPDYPLIDPLRAELAAVEDTNRRVRDNQRAIQMQADIARIHGDYEAHTRQIAELDKTKADTLAAAEFPIDGLGFDEQGVTYLGRPLSSASSAEAAQVSLAIGRALNPTLRVILIRDGSLLDSDAMKAIHEDARSTGYQIWIERVEDSSDGAIFIEDGQAVAK